MKHTTEELIFAAMVIEMSRKMQDSSQPRDVTPDELSAWVEENPIEKFIPDTIHVIECIADNIRRLRSET